jgi:hypothetical protein
MLIGRFVLILYILHKNTDAFQLKDPEIREKQIENI